MIPLAIKARQILDSRHEKTIAVEVENSEGRFEASAPSGKSIGKNEKTAFGKDINFSIEAINLLGRKICSERIVLNSFDDLRKIEDFVRKIDKTSRLEIFGANALYALEAALLKAMAASNKEELWQFLLEENKNEKIRLPLPLGNVIGGGMHIEQKQKTDFQEFLFLPRTQHFFDAYFINLQAYKIAKKLLVEKDSEWQGELTDENALAPTLSNEDVLKIMIEAKREIEEKFGVEIGIGIDVAASSFYHGFYYYKNKKAKLSRDQQLEYIARIAKKHGLTYVEDPLHEEDFSGFARLRKILAKLNVRCLVCGDDLTCTQLSRVEKAVGENAIDALLIKPNQVGSLLETKDVIDFAKHNNITPIISHRSGETCDDTIAHLAVGWQLPFIKTGVLGKERFAKLHALLRIERKL